MALTDNLVAYYKYDSNNSNDSVSSNHGTDTSISYSACKINNGAVFNGSSSKITVPSAIYSLFNSTNNWTFSSWIYIASNPGSNYAIYSGIAGVSNGGYYRNFTAVITSTGEFMAQRCNGAGAAIDYVYTTGSLNTGAWNLCVATYDGSTLSVSLNGASSQTVSSTISATSATVGTLGLWTEGSVDYYWLNGKQDETGFWSRAITSTEITELYNAGAGLAYPFSSTSQNSNFFLM